VSATPVEQRFETNPAHDNHRVTCHRKAAPAAISLEGTGEILPSLRGEQAKKAAAKNKGHRLI
jgi:hypothetical protein